VFAYLDNLASAQAVPALHAHQLQEVSEPVAVREQAQQEVALAKSGDGRRALQKALEEVEAEGSVRIFKIFGIVKIFKIFGIVRIFEEGEGVRGKEVGKLRLQRGVAEV
jgi:hypothetical protein